ncbi:unnamed protein product [Zymoseptoria tritici ST99CH_1A5]|uniref:C3H1-type domain-containing protein n=1 Tax=Zymoseptoria tritici ST99CH_1A5 TaxID=1276529 RepID=A0A1Y6LZN1_ZYMTR|nr:unnamed protein product [Zymoseptoria tritici ST99CH_1A5]
MAWYSRQPLLEEDSLPTSGSSGGVFGDPTVKVLVDAPQDSGRSDGFFEIRQTKERKTSSTNFERRQAERGLRDFRSADRSAPSNIKSTDKGKKRRRPDFNSPPSKRIRDDVHTQRSLGFLQSGHSVISTVALDQPLSMREAASARSLAPTSVRTVRDAAAPSASSPPAIPQTAGPYRPSPTPEHILRQTCTYQVNGFQLHFCENLKDGPEHIKHYACGKRYHICTAWWENILNEDDKHPPCSFGGQDGSVHKDEEGKDVIHERVSCRHWLNGNCQYRTNGCKHAHNRFDYRTSIRKRKLPQCVLDLVKQKSAKNKSA